MAQILLVEDEEDLRDNLEIVLTHAGHEILTAGDGRAALDVIQNTPPDIVVSDISMPIMSGLQMLATVRGTMPALADMPIILLTALGDRENVIDGRETGADDYLTKPVDYQVLLATIDARLARHDQAKALKERQFVKLFKGLTQNPDAAPPGRSAADAPLERIAALARNGLRGRTQLIFPEEFLHDLHKLPAGARDKVLAAQRRILDDWLTANDVAVELGGGATLLAIDAPDRTSASERFIVLRMRLRQAFGPHQAHDDGEAGETGDGGDYELKETLKAHYFKSQNAEGSAHAATFEDLAQAFTVAYEPILDARTKDAAAFRACWRRSMAGAAPTDDDALLLGAADPLMCDLVGFVMDAAARDLMTLRGRLHQGRELPMIVMQIPLAAFQDLSIYKIERQIDDLAQLLDRNLVGFHLTGSYEDMALGALRKIFNNLSRAGEFLALDVDLNMGKPERLLGLGCKTLRVDAGLIDRAGLPPDRMRRIIAGGVRQAKENGFEIWATGVDDAATGRLLIAAGATLLSGKVVGPPRPTPDFERPATG